MNQKHPNGFCSTHEAIAQYAALPDTDENKGNELRAQLTDETVGKFAQHLSSQGFRTLKLIGRGSFSAVFETTAHQILRVSFGEPEGRPLRADTLGHIFRQDFTIERQHSISGFTQDYLKVELNPRIDFKGLTYHDALAKEELDRILGEAEKLQASYAHDDLMLVDARNNFGRMKDGTLILTDADPEYIYGPSHDFYPYTQGAREELRQKYPKEMLASLPDTQWVDEEGMWHQKKLYPNLTTGQAFDAEFAATGKAAGVLSDADIEDGRAGGDVKFWCNDGKQYSPEFESDAQKIGFLNKVAGGDYPLDAVKEMHIELSLVKDWQQTFKRPLIRETSSIKL